MTKQTSWMKLKPPMKQSMQRSDPGMMKEGVTKSVANDIGVPWRVVQRVWRDGQIGGGVEAFKSKKKNCGRKNFLLTLMPSKMCRLGNAVHSMT
ncbi:hypothetical protein E2562_007816 [Oryza meyeriana var. granulata]|uniref:Uncharacterized protein n=1 Tax=Oryza meyeriana var. granulata TaxID=110450 RepID=A0A6G1F516_9ORYZ|nr:hypothetical protein E2562_007816 [Oryza meyeriana var. granulata]